MPFNVYQLYEHKGCKCPFVVSQVSWGKTAFVVESIGGQLYGPLPGKPPYFGNLEVCGYYFDTVTNEVIPDRFGGNGVLSCPGNYKWVVLVPKDKSYTDEQVYDDPIDQLIFNTNR